MGSTQPLWPADSVEHREVDKLIPYARNARTHTEAQVAKLAASIVEFGWTVPILVDEQDNLIAGHGRVLAARKLNLETVPVMVARGWSESKRRAYVLADNRLALDAGWDEELLRAELQALIEQGYNVDLTGFEDYEVDNLTILDDVEVNAQDGAGHAPTTREIDTSQYKMAHTCPRCGFEYD